MHELVQSKTDFNNGVFLLTGFNGGDFTWNQCCGCWLQIKIVIDDIDFMKTFSSFSGIALRLIKTDFDTNKCFIPLKWF